MIEETGTQPAAHDGTAGTPIARETLTIGGRRVTVLGIGVATPTAIEQLRSGLQELSPDAIVVDYDSTRWTWQQRLKEDDSVDLVQVIRAGQFGELNARLAMGVLMRVLSPRDGVGDEAEHIEAHAFAAEHGTRIVYGRRNVDDEFLRAWRSCTVGERFGLGVRLFTGSLRRSHAGAASFDVVSAAQAAERILGTASTVVFDEAALWLHDVIAQVPQEENVVVVAARTTVENLKDVTGDEPREGLDYVPPKTALARAMPWIFTGLIITAFVLGFIFADPAKMQQAAVAWFASNMTFAALGAILALSHPVTVIATSLSAPFVSLNPAVGAGMVGALVQAFVAPPTVRDMDRVGDDIAKLSGWWRNGLAKLVLIFIFANAFSTIGSFAAFAWFPTD